MRTAFALISAKVGMCEEWTVFDRVREAALQDQKVHRLTHS